MKLLALLTPPAVVTMTLTVPYLALAGTLHLMRVSLQERYVAHLVAPYFTELAPRAAPKPVPVMVTVAPRLPAVGASFAMAGAGMTVKLATLVPVPPGVVTAMRPWWRRPERWP